MGKTTPYKEYISQTNKKDKLKKRAMEKQVNFTDTQIETGKTALLQVMAGMKKFNEAIGNEGTPDSFTAQLPILKEVTSALLILEDSNPVGAITKAAREQTRARLFKEDGFSPKQNLQMIMMAFAIVGKEANTMGAQIRVASTYWPLITEAAEVYANELATKK